MITQRHKDRGEQVMGRCQRTALLTPEDEAEIRAFEYHHSVREVLTEWRKYWENEHADALTLTGKQADELCTLLHIPFDGAVDSGEAPAPTPLGPRSGGRAGMSSHPTVELRTPRTP